MIMLQGQELQTTIQTMIALMRQAARQEILPHLPKDLLAKRLLAVRGS